MRSVTVCFPFSTHSPTDLHAPHYAPVRSALKRKKMTICWTAARILKLIIYLCVSQCIVFIFIYYVSINTNDACTGVGKWREKRFSSETTSLYYTNIIRVAADDTFTRGELACCAVSVCPQMPPLAATQETSLMTSPFDRNAYASASPHVCWTSVALELQWNHSISLGLYF